MRPRTSSSPLMSPTSANWLRYADLLRAVGQMLDAEGAETVEIADDTFVLTVTWIDRHGEEQVRTLDKMGDGERIRHDARRHRGSAIHDTTKHIRGELLRTLGQELDLAESHLVRIKEIHGFKVSIVENDRHIDRWYSHDELLEKSRARRMHRAAEAQPAAAGWRFPSFALPGSGRSSRP